MMISIEDQEQLNKIKKILYNCNSVLFITGAGVSAESGLPTYRGIGGLYENKNTKEDLPIEVILSDQMISINPKLSWKYIAEMEEMCRDAKHSKVHSLIKQFEEKFKRVVVLTQNVDGLHQQAGSKDVIDIHGDFRDLYCMNDKCSYKLRVKNYKDISIPPKCPICGTFLRPDVVLFGEHLPMKKLNRLLQELAKGFSIIFTIGTTSLFPYISRPVTLAKDAGIPTVEINPGFTMVSDIVDFKIKIKASAALEQLY